MLEFFILNYHLAGFFFMFLSGLVFLILAPAIYRLRTKKLFVTPKDLVKYNRIEKKLLILGAALAFIGIVGVAFISEKYGYYRTVTDIHGTKIIENSKKK